MRRGPRPTTPEKTSGALRPWLIAAVIALVAAGVLGQPTRSRAATPGLAAGASDPLFSDDEPAASFSDPFEPLNRGTYWLNRQIDRFLLDPLSRVYLRFFPTPGQHAVRNFFANLSTPAVCVNELLQGDVDGFAVATARFTVNSTAGLGGILDTATGMDLPQSHTGFGDTLARAGVGSGPYLMLPVLGPTTARDALGTAVDLLLRPTTFLTFGTDSLLYATLDASAGGFATRAAHSEGLRALQSGAVDPYAALRSAYFQNRSAELRQPGAAATSRS